MPAQDHVLLYGDSKRADPYSGPMLGVAWGPDANHAGDGDTTPVRVRGTDGVSAPITVFQQTILPKLGTVIAWREDGMGVGLYGRFWDKSRTKELVALAERLERVRNGFEFPRAALPDGYEEEVFRGPSDSLGLISASRLVYLVHYRPRDGRGLLSLTGLFQSEGEFDAVRFLTLGLEQTQVGDRSAFVGNAWRENGPAVVMWRDDEGFVVRLVGLNVGLTIVKELAERSRELSQREWQELKAVSGKCPDVSPPR